MKQERKITIKNKLGLHARPAAMFVQIANKFDATIKVSKGDQTVNGKSIMGILMLEANQGSVVILSADGHDCTQAIEELSALLLTDIDVEGKKK